VNADTLGGFGQGDGHAPLCDARVSAPLTHSSAGDCVPRRAVWHPACGCGGPKPPAQLSQGLRLAPSAHSACCGRAGRRRNLCPGCHRGGAAGPPLGEAARLTSMALRVNAGAAHAFQP
jgi:hypothetical protein